MEGAFVDGVAFVPLAALTDLALVVPTIAEVVGVRESGSQPLAERLRAFLRDPELLLVLDNVEQGAAAAADIAALLADCPHLKALMSSRAVLRVYGERAFPVPPLAPPGRSPSGSAIGSRWRACCTILGGRAGFLVKDEEARTSHEEAPALARELGDAARIAMDLENLAAAWAAGALHGARARIAIVDVRRGRPPRNTRKQMTTRP
jgi:predicted ATPase